MRRSRELEDKLVRGLLGNATPVFEGAIVYLKSGSPPMTVRSVGEGGVVCDWFEKSGKHISRNFSLNMLTAVATQPGGKTAGLIVIGDLTAEIVDHTLGTMSEGKKHNTDEK